MDLVTPVDVVLLTDILLVMGIDVVTGIVLVKDTAATLYAMSKLVNKTACHKSSSS